MGAEAPLERVDRDERARVVAVLARRLGDLDLAEDAVQEALARAADVWPRDGVPDRPGAWLTTVAWRRALDVRRAERHLVPGAVPDAPAPAADPLALVDDVLALILACCHPALAPEAQVALTLRHVARLTVAEIAAAFLVAEEAMAKRLVRARGKLRTAGVRLTPPTADALAERLAAAHAVVYLIFTEGHTTSTGDAPVRTDLCDEAVWLAEQLHLLVPTDAETTGLLALLLLTAARGTARQDAAGRLLPFAEQDRSRWDADAIARARSLLATTGFEPPGPYQVQAAAALVHVTAPPGGDPDWARLAELHRVLGRIAPSPVVEVNRAVVVGRSAGARAGLAVLAPVLRSGRLDRYAPLHAVHADLLERAGDRAAAVVAWGRAADVSGNGGQRAALERRAANTMSSPPAGPRRPG